MKSGIFNQISCKTLGEQEKFEKSSLASASKMKLPKFMMTLAEFRTSNEKQTIEKDSNGIYFRIYNSDLIESDYDWNDDDTKGSSARDSNPEFIFKNKKQIIISFRVERNFYIDNIIKILCSVILLFNFFFKIKRFECPTKLF